MDEHGVLVDEHTGLHVAWYFWLRVLDEVNRSARYGAPFGLLLLDAVAGRDAPRKALEEASSRVRDAIRGTDLAGVLGPGRVAVLLIEQDIEGAERAAGRIIDRIGGGGRSLHWETALLCHPRDAAELSNLLTTGATERIVQSA